MLNYIHTILTIMLFVFGVDGQVCQTQAKNRDNTKLNSPRPGALARLPQVISEASGLCRSLLKQGYYWTHNDSLDQARLFLITDHGQLHYEVSLIPVGLEKTDQKTRKNIEAQAQKQSRQTAKQKNHSVSNVDWEGCSSVHTDLYDGQSVVYVADTGNNFQWRQDLKIYAFQESVKTQGTKKFTSPLLNYLKSYSIRFPNSKRPSLDYWSDEGRCRDIEAIFWRQNELFLISKCIISGPAMLWRVPRERIKSKALSNKAKQERLTLEALQKLPIAASQHPLLERVTDASYAEHINMLAVLTYQSIWFYEVSGSAQNPSFKPFAHCKLNQVPRLVRQAEAISWHALQDDKAELIVLTESRDVYSYVLDFNQKDCVYD